MPKLLIIFASTRPSRAGQPVCEWFAERARAHGGFDVEIADLADINLPFMDEPEHPRLRRYVHQHTKDWSALVDGADAFAIVTPEYNYGMLAPLKNALDFLNHEWAYKPVGFVSYGGVAAGTRGVQMAKQVVTTLKMTPLFEAVSIPFFTQFIGEDDVLTPNDIMTQSADAMLDELVRMEEALRPLRSAG
jgi:NAD(P)H-dependent FMN reductase